ETRKPRSSFGRMWGGGLRRSTKPPTAFLTRAASSSLSATESRLLTVKLRSRTTTPDERRGRTLSPGARGAKPTTPHGPLQPLLEVTVRYTIPAPHRHPLRQRRVTA